MRKICGHHSSVRVLKNLSGKKSQYSKHNGKFSLLWIFYVRISLAIHAYVFVFTSNNEALVRVVFVSRYSPAIVACLPAYSVYTLYIVQCTQCRYRYTLLRSSLLLFSFYCGFSSLFYDCIKANDTRGCVTLCFLDREVLCRYICDLATSFHLERKYLIVWLSSSPSANQHHHSL